MDLAAINARRTVFLFGLFLSSVGGPAPAAEDQAANDELTPSAASLQECWEYDHAYLQRLIADRGGYAGLYQPGEDAPDFGRYTESEDDFPRVLRNRHRA